MLSLSFFFLLFLYTNAQDTAAQLTTTKPQKNDINQSTGSLEELEPMNVHKLKEARKKMKESASASKGPAARHLRTGTDATNDDSCTQLHLVVDLDQALETHWYTNLHTDGTRGAGTQGGFYGPFFDPDTGNVLGRFSTHGVFYAPEKFHRFGHTGFAFLPQVPVGGNATRYASSIEVAGSVGSQPAIVRGTGEFGCASGYQARKVVTLNDGSRLAFYTLTLCGDLCSNDVVEDYDDEFDF